ncbi:MAG: sulfotransferase family 2 domain-containing protein [bacterium]|nr:sulfotransferase family 2 domain-containing protein [bacterium]
MISHRHRCIFIHIPKCGGTSIEDVLWPDPRTEAELWMGFVSPLHNAYQTGGLQHLTAPLVRRVVGETTFASYYRFAVIRNPWDRAVSQFVFMRRRPDLRAYLGVTEDGSFKHYLERLSEREHVQWMPQWRFLYDDDGSLLVEDVLRFERLEEDAARVFRRLGVDAALPHAKRGEREPLASYYDDDAREMVARIYAEDIRRFGYRFPGV